jgi:hypothetical protein
MVTGSRRWFVYGAVLPAIELYAAVWKEEATPPVYFRIKYSGIYPNIWRIIEVTGTRWGPIVSINTEGELLSFAVCQFFLRLKSIPETNW